MPEVSVITVCMGGPQKHLEACLRSLYEHNRVSLEVLVVAYLWKPEDEKAFAAANPSVTLIPSREIRGFSENNNLALPLAKGRYCFLVNDDTLQDEPVIDRLVASLEKLPENAAAVSPCIRFADGRIQTCGRKAWTTFRYAKHYLHLVDESEEGVCPRTSGHPRPDKGEGPTACRGRGREATVRGHTPSSDSYQTYTINGACFLIKTGIFKEMGWFDERFFFTPEDIALGHKLNDAGYTVWVNPDVNITHLAGGSVSAMDAAIKPARVRGYMIFFGEPLWLKCFVWCVEAFRYRILGRKAARNVMEAVFSQETPKEIFIKFKP